MRIAFCYAVNSLSGGVGAPLMDGLFFVLANFIIVRTDVRVNEKSEQMFGFYSFGNEIV